MKNNKDIYAVILCGGLGKRLKSVVSDRPKCMALIHDRPFLDILVEYIASFHIHNFVFCVGYKAEMIEDYYKKKKHTLNILLSRETELLGTGGAIKNSEAFIKSNPFFVFNGDSICKLNLIDFFKFHQEKHAVASLALVNSQTLSFGMVKIDPDQRVSAFCEKQELDAHGLVNAGVYLFDQDVLTMIPQNIKFSLEYDLFPKIERCYGYVTHEKLIDIGTPERYLYAQDILK